MRLLIIMAAFLAFLAACNKDFTGETQAPEFVLSQEELLEIGDNFCSTADGNGGAEDRATGMKGKFWPKGTVLRVKFMNGSHTLRKKVFDYAQTWVENANISLQRVDTGQSDIRVRFGMNGNNSLIGTDNQSVSQNKATMNLQLTDFSSEEKIRRAALHEFGHALGLAHEHKSPLANIPWNKPKVYAYYAATQGWDQQTVDANVLTNLGWGPAQHTYLDTRSVMAYPIPDSLTTNGFSIPWNTELSAMDKEFIQKIYDPKIIHIRHDADINGTVTFLLNGVFTTLKKGEGIFVPINPLDTNLKLWECPDGCMWSNFNVSWKLWFKIVSNPDNPNDLHVFSDGGSF